MHTTATNPEEMSQLDQRLRQLTGKHEVRLSSKGLVLPRVGDATIDAKIANSFSEVVDKVQTAKKQGLDIIFLPGSYDLVHAGHLSYLDQVVEHYLTAANRRGRTLKRKDLFVVMLADDDHLIELVKASKHVDFGGKERFRRPIERAKQNSDRHIRLDTLAALPVDCVGFIPSPAAMNLPAPFKLDVDYCKELAAREAAGDELNTYYQIIESYQNLPALIANHGSLSTSSVQVAAWQLYILSQLAQPSYSQLRSEPEPYSGKNMTRIVSIHDTGYLKMVQMISRWADIAVDVIEDDQVLSTTELLAGYGPEALLQHKLDEAA